MSQLYVGLDVHCKESVFVIQAEDGTVVARGSVPTTPEGYGQLREKHTLVAGTPVGLETGTMALYSTRLLTRLELKPVVIDAREVRQKARRPNQKCDQRDAFEICQGLRTGSYQSIVHVPPERVQLLRETLSRRRHFVRQATSEVNATKRLLRAAGLQHLGVRRLASEAAWRSLLKDLEAEIHLVEFVSAHFAMWTTATEEIAEFGADLQKLEEDPQFAEDARRLRTIPGVGRIVALTALAVLSDVDRFPTAKHVASYAGLVPSTYHSGKREASGHITKRGSCELRAMLCERNHPFLGICRTCSPLRLGMPRPRAEAAPASVHQRRLGLPAGPPGVNTSESNAEVPRCPTRNGTRLGPIRPPLTTPPLPPPQRPSPRSDAASIPRESLGPS